MKRFFHPKHTALSVAKDILKELNGHSHHLTGSPRLDANKIDKKRPTSLGPADRFSMNTTQDIGENASDVEGYSDSAASSETSGYNRELSDFSIGRKADNALPLKLVCEKNVRKNPHQPSNIALFIGSNLILKQKIQTELKMRNDELIISESEESMAEVVRDKEYPIIFVDESVIGMKIYSVCKMIRRSDLNRLTPIVLFVNGSSSLDKLKCILAGVDTILHNPIGPNELGLVYQKLISAKQNTPKNSTSRWHF